jgi:mono/diheme cytochrome c family protein
LTIRIRAAAVFLLATAIAGTALAQTRGADVFKAKCARCHDANGLATTPMAKGTGAKSFKSPELMKWSDDQFFAYVKKTYRTNAPTDAQIKDVVAYIRQLQK